MTALPLRGLFRPVEDSCQFGCYAVIVDGSGITL